MRIEKHPADTEVISKVDVNISLTNEAMAKINLVDQVKLRIVQDNFVNRYKELIQDYDTQLNDLILTLDSKPKEYTNPYHPEVTGCDCKVCKMCYRLIDGEKVTVQDMKEANVTLSQITFALVLATTAKELSVEKAEEIIKYVVGIHKTK